MLKKRIIACIIVRNGWAVQSIGFHKYLPVGSPEIIAETLDRWFVDEIVIQDISQDRKTNGPNLDLIRGLATRIATPLTVAGGISTIDHVRNVLAAGADKVAVNTEAILRPSFISEIADRFGAQSVVGSVDVKKQPDGSVNVFNRSCLSSNLSLKDHVQTLIKERVGELLINSVDRDGSKAGYDLDVYSNCVGDISVPLIAVGGAGCTDHMCEVLTIPTVDAAAAANIWTFTEHSVSVSKSILEAKGCCVRHDGNIRYTDRVLGIDHRPQMPSELHLASLRKNT